LTNVNEYFENRHLINDLISGQHDIQQNDSITILSFEGLFVASSITTLCFECRYAVSSSWVSLCWVSLCCMSLCWVSLCWMLWRRLMVNTACLVNASSVCGCRIKYCLLKWAYSFALPALLVPATTTTTSPLVCWSVGSFVNYLQNIRFGKW
jgi:hypothetical protein